MNRGISDIHPFLGGSLQVDIFPPDPLPSNDLYILCNGDGFGIHYLRLPGEYHRIRIPDFAQKGTPGRGSTGLLKDDFRDFFEYFNPVRLDGLGNIDFHP